jgi:hypothetical protein
MLINLIAQAIDESNSLKLLLMKPRPLRIIVCSPSEVTLSLLHTMLSGFLVTSASSIDEAEACLRTTDSIQSPWDFLILDEQSESNAVELARFIHSLHFSALPQTKIVQLYTPTTDSLSSHPLSSPATPGVIKMTKPPRKARLLQTLAGLKDLPGAMITSRPTDVTKAMEDLASARRTLYGNVLIAEGATANFRLSREVYASINCTRQSCGTETAGPPVATISTERYGHQQRDRGTCWYRSIFYATTLDLMIIAPEWESHGPGYFGVALFDHRTSAEFNLLIHHRPDRLSDMPICDGIEAARRIRLLESERKLPIPLPSQSQNTHLRWFLTLSSVVPSCRSER